MQTFRDYTKNEPIQRLMYCQSKTWFGCVSEKLLITSNVSAFVLLGYLLCVYLWRYGTICDLRIGLLALAFSNSLFVLVNEIYFSFKQRM